MVALIVHGSFVFTILGSQVSDFSSDSLYSVLKFPISAPTRLVKLDIATIRRLSIEEVDPTKAIMPDHNATLDLELITLTDIVHLATAHLVDSLPDQYTHKKGSYSPPPTHSPLPLRPSRTHSLCVTGNRVAAMTFS